MRRFMSRLTKDKRGATAIEYGMICALVFLVAVGAMSNFGAAATAKFNYIAANVSGPLK